MKDGMRLIRIDSPSAARLGENWNMVSSHAFKWFFYRTKFESVRTSTKILPLKEFNSYFSCTTNQNAHSRPTLSSPYRGKTKRLTLGLRALPNFSVPHHRQFCVTSTQGDHQKSNIQKIPIAADCPVRSSSSVLESWFQKW